MSLESFSSDKTDTKSKNNTELFDSRVNDISSHQQDHHSSTDTFNPDSRVNSRLDTGWKSESNGDYSPDKRVVTKENIGISNPDKLSSDQKIKIQNSEIASFEKRGLQTLDSQERGKYGEMKTDQDMRERGYSRISKDMIVNRDTELKQGIDGVYENKNGKPPIAIVDAKFGSSKLNNTLDGKQMSPNWIDNRLDASVGKTKADQIRMTQLTNPNKIGYYVARVDTSGKVSYDKLDSKVNVIERNCKL